jgi:hypothetical protein
MQDVSRRPFKCVPVSDIVIFFARLGPDSVFRFHRHYKYRYRHSAIKRKLRSVRSIRAIAAQVRAKAEFWHLSR